MPKALENSLMRQARRLAKSGKLRQAGKAGKNAYVWGTMRKIEKQHQAKGGSPGKYLHNV